MSLDRFNDYLDGIKVQLALVLVERDKVISIALLVR